jgi:SAM-dependent methyltransferase
LTGKELRVTESQRPTGTESAEERYRRNRREQWDRIARRRDSWRGVGGYYHRRLAYVYRFLIPEGARVLELGCGQGDLLAALKPRLGVGVDFSSEMVRRGRERHPDLTFIEADVHDLPVTGEFDYIILSDLVNDLWDVQRVFERLAPHTLPSTRIIVNFYSHLWQLPLKAAQRLGLATPLLEQNWFTPVDLANLAQLADFEVVKRFEEILSPLPLWPLHLLANSVLAKTWPCRLLALTNFFVLRPRPLRAKPVREPRVSVIVPARNEAGNIANIFARTPEMGGGTELVFVEGGSRDDTYRVIEEEMAAHPERSCQLMRQTGVGKGDAVRLGFAAAKGDILMILDADLTVPPEDLPRFYAAVRDGKGEFINGVRLVYPMEEQAMRFLNLLGNKFFSLVFTWLLGQPIRDSLCGTKVLRRDDYEALARNRSYFGDFDPFGDFDLLFGAAKLNLRILEIPVRYRERTYGDTNIQRFRHGLLLLRMVVFAARKIKFF